MMAPAFPLVAGKEGFLGRLESELQESGTSSALVSIHLEDGRQIQVPQELLTRQDDGSYFLPLTLKELEQSSLHLLKVAEAGMTVPVIAEELRVETRTVETGRVRIYKTVQEREEFVDPPLLRDDVTVVRVPVGRLCEGEPPGTRQEGETLIIPVFEEVLVVEKWLMLKEEIHVRREQSTFHAPQNVTLRHEEVRVERVPMPEHTENAEMDPA